MTATAEKTTRKKKTPVQEEMWEGKRDPDMYARLSRPFPTEQASKAAVSAFFKDMYDLRVKHGIRDVTLLAAVGCVVDGQEVDSMQMLHSGDARNALPMVAGAFRSLRETDEQSYLRLAGLLNDPNILVPNRATKDLLSKVARAATADTGKPWTATDTLHAMVREGLIQAEIIGTLMEFAAEGPRSPADEIGMLRGALKEVLFNTGIRMEKILARVKEIEDKHPELKVAAAEEKAEPAHPPPEPEIEPSVGDEPPVPPPATDAPSTS